MTDTIAAISTAVGPGAVSIVRLSGPGALDIADRVFCGRGRPSTSEHKSVLLGEIIAPDSTPIDQVVLLIMRRPGSYTGEDVVEVSCHGGISAPRLVLRRLIDEGARPAEPGEFTKRAFLNGKMDLAQAEAVSEMVQARSEKALQAAMRQIRGDLSSRIGRMETALLDQIALVEANIDFPDEEIEGVYRPGLEHVLGDLANGLEHLLSSYGKGRFIKEGIEAVIVGKPNVGKSSLFNRLVGKDRVIVSHVPGTTRDVVDAVVPIDGLLVNLHDTAGLLEPRDNIETSAVERTRASLDESDVVMVVIDASQPLDDADAGIVEQTSGKRRMIVFNKIDLEDIEEHFSEAPEVRVSALEGSGMSDLLGELRRISEDLIGDLADEIIISERHAICLREALDGIGRARKGLSEQIPLELIASDLRTALLGLGRITGSNASENLLDEIFSRFCIGK